MTQKEKIERIERKIGITLGVKDGKPYFGGFLNLRGIGITALPEGLTVGGHLDLRETGITALPEGLTVGGALDLEGCASITSLPEGLTVGGYLDLRGTSITALPEGLTVGGTIYLCGMSITALPEGLTVGGALDLEGCTPITSLPEGLIVGGHIDLRGTSITTLPEGLTVGLSLYLRGTSITALPEGLTVGGNLDLDGCTSITALPEGLTVGGNLDLDGCTSITALPEGLTVGGGIYFTGTGITDTTKVRRVLTSEQRGKINAVVNRVIEWQWNGRHYIKADDEFTVVDAHRGNVYRVHYLGKSEQLYLVTDGEGHWAHGETLRDARADLLYKVSDRDVSAYKGLPLDTELPFSELVAMYRTITGACAAGTRNFVENRLPQPRKDRYTIAEMLRLTEGEYGSERIKEFFSV